MKHNNLLVLLVVFAVIGVSTVGSVSAASTGNNSTLNATNTTNTTVNTAIATNATGQSNYTGPQTNTTKWTNSSIYSVGKVTVTKNGTIYVMGHSDSTLYAFKSDGTLLWSDYLGTGTANNGLVVGSDGTIYALDDGTLFAVYSNGTIKWKYNTGSVGAPYGDPVLDSNGIIYFTSNLGNVYAIDTKTNPNDVGAKWVYSTGKSLTSHGAISSDGKTLYVGSYGAVALYALNTADGTLKWSYSTGTSSSKGGIQSTPVIGSDGTIYVATYGTGILYAITDNGDHATVKWNTTIGSSYGNIAISSNGTIYVGCFKTGVNFYAVNSSDGSILYNCSLTKATSVSTPVIGSDGTIYIGTTNGILYALNPDLTTKWIYTASGSGSLSSPTIGPDGTLYVSRYGCGLYAFQDLVGNFTSTAGSNLNVQFNDSSSNIPTSWSWSFGDGSTSTEQNPMHTYAANGTYTVSLTVTTAYGDTNTVTKTVTVKDITAPTVSGIGYNTPNKSITVNFSEPVELGTGWIELLDSTGKAVSFTKSINGSVLTIKPTVGLVNGAKYRLLLHTGSITDLSGNNVAGYVYSFTVDGTAPTVKIVDPANNAVNVAVSKVIKVTFSEAIQNGTGWIELLNSTGKAVSFTKSINGNVLSITPTNALVKGTKYILLLHTGCVTDLTGNNLKGYVSRFTTDSTAPTVKTVDPANNAVNVAANKVIKVTFSEAIQNGNGSIELLDSTGKAVSFTKSISGNVLTITPDNALVKGTKYMLLLHTGSVTDLAGNNLKGYVSRFTVDSTVPTVKTIDPANNAVNVAIDKVIKVTFSETVKAGNGSIELVDSTGKAVSFTKSISGNVLTITPDSALVKGTKYMLLLHTGCVTDLAGNNLKGYVSRFTV
ncbi:Ig-like domain-containing protein [Methanobacterium paludis]|uniref:PKD domain containing protein n=1 Tax=Methanobacterium paludis (strain DSM 25820 / JCM 18151 / SWAN1) TaxID=868131 RepID=F6D604_METPW|nr:Ig-like domain-containing protein [Methanobacterium paludis]AEG19374.1 PKD domain containing protein [Methanobacterium paludis]